ncbi:hypothetical protein INR49_014924 [Caranx melampygus]|nr:hypothetical protein INR49_014924 [Caranx melampygus]
MNHGKKIAHPEVTLPKYLLLQPPLRSHEDRRGRAHSVGTTASSCKDTGPKGIIGPRNWIPGCPGGPGGPGGPTGPGSPLGPCSPAGPTVPLIPGGPCAP